MPCESEDVMQSIINRINPIHNLKIVPLEPGVELDELIAAKVLGWKPSTWPGIWIDDMCRQNSLSHFSTDIKAAWDLAEKFKLCVIPWDEARWTAIRCGQIFVDGERNKAPTAPHAICLAALFYASEDDE